MENKTQSGLQIPVWEYYYIWDKDTDGSVRMYNDSGGLKCDTRTWWARVAWSFEDIETIKDWVFAVTSEYLSWDTVSPDGDDGNFFDIYLDRATTRVNMPVNLREGEVCRFQIRQDMTWWRAIKRWTKIESTGLTCNLTKWTGTSVVLAITAGTFDRTSLQSTTGRRSFLNMTGFAQNATNIEGVKITSFDESGWTITFNHPFYDSISDVTGDTWCTIWYENAFYFIDEKWDSWVSQTPFGVTQFTFYSTTDWASGILKKEGVYSNSIHHKTKVRFEEELTDDFINGSDNGFLNRREANSNWSVGISSADVDSSHIGIIALWLNSATADSRASNTLGNDMFNISNIRAGINGICMFNENALETAGVKYYFWWTDNNKFQSALDWAYFEIVADGSTDGYGRVLCVTEIGWTRTAYDTGIDLPEDERFTLHIGIPPNWWVIHFVVNDINVHEAARSTMWDTVKLTCGFASYYGYTGTVLPNVKTMFIDAFSLKYRLSWDRI